METKINLLHPDEQTIIAQCTPIGSGAIALIRITGTDALIITDRAVSLAGNKTLVSLPSHTIHYGAVHDTHGTPIDQVLLLLMKGPKTFTGHDTIEITCHNNQFIVQNIIEVMLYHGARLAQPGEFTKRAVLNNKIDVLQAEAINELIHANSQHTLKGSLAQLQGSFSAWITHIEKKLIHCLALSEASFEFIDEEYLSFGHEIHAIIQGIVQEIKIQKSRFQQQNHIRQGIRIAIIGSVNSGKSSLFNALLSKDRAIVSDIAGTTRDSIEASMYNKGLYWTLIDTAGLRQTDHSIEQQGIERSWQEAQLADIIILTVDSSRSLTLVEQEAYHQLQDSYGAKIIGVLTKSDEPQKHNLQTEIIFCSSVSTIVSVSSKTKQNIDLLHNTIEQKIAQLLESTDTPFLLNERHYNKLMHLEQSLCIIQNMLQEQIQYELVSYHLNDALTHISELTGKTMSEEGMDAIFRNFCVGK